MRDKLDRRSLLLSKEAEWRRISDVIRRYGLTSLAIQGNIECYRVAAAGNTTPEAVPYADEIVRRDIAEILKNGRGLFDSVLDIPEVAEKERQTEAGRQLAMLQAEADRNRSQQKAADAADRARRRRALEAELGISLEGRT